MHSVGGVRAKEEEEEEVGLSTDGGWMEASSADGGHCVRLLCFAAHPPSLLRVGFRRSGG